MKTITEFSGTVLREAARIRRAHRPQRPEPAPQPAAEEGGAPVEEALPASAEDAEAAAAADAADEAAGGELAGAPV